MTEDDFFSGFVLPAMHQAVGTDLPTPPLCSERGEKEPRENTNTE